MLGAERGEAAGGGGDESGAGGERVLPRHSGGDGGGLRRHSGEPGESTESDDFDDESFDDLPGLGQLWSAGRGVRPSREGPSL